MILDYGGNWSKNSIWYKIHQYFNENKKHDEINSLISEICNNLNKNALILLKTALISMDNLYYVLDLLDVLKANYDGKHTISLTDPESRWMMDKKGNMGLNYNYQVAVDSKNGIWHKIHQYFNKNKKHDEINSLINEISNNLNKNALILLKTALISMDKIQIESIHKY